MYVLTFILPKVIDFKGYKIDELVFKNALLFITLLNAHLSNTPPSSINDFRYPMPTLLKKYSLLFLLLATIVTGIITSSASHQLPFQLSGRGAINKELIDDESKLPDFSAYHDIQLKKQAFFNFLLPLIDAENQQILSRRERLLTLKDSLNNNKALSLGQRHWLETTASLYREPYDNYLLAKVIDNLLAKVDIVAPSLVLSQSANESAWGTSRFAKEGNNLFGQWCFTSGCGMMPKQRSENSRHEVAAYSSPQKSVASYIHNLNTHEAYSELRGLRWTMRQNNQPLNGVTLANGLKHYSSRGDAYIQEIQGMIKTNQLGQYDTI